VCVCVNPSAFVLGEQSGMGSEILYLYMHLIKADLLTVFH